MVQRKRFLFRPLTLLLSVLIVCGAVYTAGAQTGPGAQTTLNSFRFMGNGELPGVSDAKAPRDAGETELLWKIQGTNFQGHAPLVVGESVYIYSNSYVNKYNLKTGVLEKSGRVMDGEVNQYQVIMSYAEGMIFVPCKRSENPETGEWAARTSIRALDAETLETLYTTETFGASDMQTPLIVHDGYMVTGAYGSNGYYAGFTIEDEDPNSGSEVKETLWSVKGEGNTSFYWNGAAFAGDYCYFADSGSTTVGKGGSKVWAVNYKTGDIAQTFMLGDKYVNKSTLVYYEKQNRVFIAANHPNNCASVRSYAVKSDGTLDLDSKREWVSGTSGGGTQSTPVIYNDRLYIGGGGGTMGSNEPFHVVDANTMTTIYTVAALKTKGSAVITTAYATAENNNTVYIYAVPYAPVSSKAYLHILRDSAVHTEPDPVATVEMGSSQFTTATPTMAHNGSLLWAMDDKALFCFGNKNDTAVTGDDVKQQIGRMPEVNEYKFYSNFELRRIKERYDSLGDAEKAKVTNYARLTAMLEASAKRPEERIGEIIAGIAALPATDKLTLENAGTVEGLYALYSAMADKTPITNGGALEAAYARMQVLKGEAAAAKLAEDIAALPAVNKLTLADTGKVTALEERLAAMDAVYAAKVTNTPVLTAARARLTELADKLSALDAVFTTTLNDTITLESKAKIDAALSLMAELAEADIKSLTSYEQFFVPAVVDYVNLLLDSLYADGALAAVTGENIASLKETLSGINTYYAHIPASQRGYVARYGAAADMAAAIAAFEKPNPATGENGSLAVPLLILSAFAGVLLSRKRRAASHR